MRISDWIQTCALPIYAFGDFVGRQDAGADRYRATSPGVIEHQRRGGLGGQAHLGVLPDVDDVIREFAVRSAVHRDGNDIEAAVHRKRFQNGCNELARATALRVADRKSGGKGKSVSVRVELWGR